MTKVAKAPIPPVVGFADLLTRCADRFGDKSCFVYHRGDETKHLSYAAFAELAFRVRDALFSAGLAGKPVALLGDTSPEWLAVFLGTVLSGGLAVPLDRESEQEEIVGFLTRSKAEAVFYAPRFATYFEKEKDRSGLVTVMLPGADGSDAAFGAFLADRPESEPPAVVPDPARASVLLFTSGTTGGSKGVLLSENNLITVMNEAYQMLCFGDNEVLLSVLPPHHTYELTCGLLTPMLYGATVCISDGLRHISRNMKEFCPTVMVLVPSLVSRFYKNVLQIAERNGELKKLLGAERFAYTLYRAGFDLRRRIFGKVLSAFGGKLSRIICGGAALEPFLVERFAALGITVSQGYGLTECAPLVSVMPLGILKPDSCGKLIGSMQCYIDKKHPADRCGEIVVKGPNVMLGYYEDEKATGEVLHMGWLHTGDYGYMDDDRYLYITGRKKNVIVLPGGRTVFPEELEEYLGQLALISEVAVVGRPTDDRDRISVVALVYPDSAEVAQRGLQTSDAVHAALEEEIKKLNRRLPAYKRITDIELRDAAFEKTTSQKIKRDRLQ
ncbi:MAG: AMP-binding protein [Clostridia bacterium]|nr:AMP-binding protein [Clostridia bacterium]